eukprot:TRINITY_DN6738_c0_g2_i2.p1 TRINITY_DN6738_c0_g2~~TRINITY_DN6738_c0_g2_i2.p1  ORF type:complete len:402 (+),score=75.06 TRINITY_DN6738_c0_g2_i2:138-1343(+)
MAWQADANEGKAWRCWLLCGPALGLWALHETYGFVLFTLSAERQRATSGRREALHESIASHHAVAIASGLDAGQTPAAADAAEGRALAAVAVALLGFVLAAAILTGLQQLPRTRAQLLAPGVVQFLLRGALLAAPAAVLAQRALGAVLSVPGVMWRSLCACVTAAVSEELAKLLVVVLWTRTAAPSSASAAVTRRCSSDGACVEAALGCADRYRSVVPSPRALALAGVAAGLGFMVAENLEYVAGEAVALGHLGQPIIFCTVGAMRMLCNLHWILVGLSASRLAPTMFARAPAALHSLGWIDWFLAIAAASWPSMCLHATWDFAVVALPRRWISVEKGNPFAATALALATGSTLVCFYVLLVRLLLSTWPRKRPGDGAAVDSGMEVSGSESSAASSDGALE